MDAATQTLLYRSEAFAEDVFDLVAGRPVAVQAPGASAPLRRSLRNAAALLIPDALRSPTRGGNELPAV